ncbi:cysteine proteinase [Hypoxylon sp. FL1150]|nr:cysteine proteinase [Hypoxylon sp. FL1150]
MTTAPKADTYPMPGAWPSELDDGDVETSKGNDVGSPTGFGANIFNAVSYLRDTSYNLYNKFFNPSHQTSGTPASRPEVDERASKRRRVAAGEYPSAIPKVESASYPRPLITPSPDSISVGDPMDIDSPCLEKFDGLNISPPLSTMRSSQSPVALNAARRATRLFSTNSQKPWPKRSKPQTVTPPRENRDLQTRYEESTHVTPPKHDKLWQTPLPPKYSNIREFFDHDNEHGLPNLEDLHLTPNITKISELDSQRQERLRIEEAKAQRAREENERIAREKEKRELRERLRQEQDASNKKLADFGLRPRFANLIVPLSAEWEQRALDAPTNGHTSEIKWQGDNHKDGVQLSPYDFSRLVPHEKWLNDNAIQAALLHLAIYINDAAGVVPKKSTPKCIALSSQYWSSYLSDKKNKLYPRGLSRTWGVRPDNFLDIDTVLIPVNSGVHWTVIVIRPSRRSIAYLDSYNASPIEHLRQARGWLQQFLGAKYAANEWRHEQFDVPRQSNTHDCGMFVITNSIYVALGIDPYCYDEADLPLQRRRIAAMLLHGGFSGPFDLSHL